MFKTFKETYRWIFLSRGRGIAYILLLFIPLIYSMIVTSSFWQPFNHMDTLKIAVVNLDKDLPANELSEMLTKNKEIKVGNKTYSYNIDDASDIYHTQAEAEEAVNNGDLAAAIVVPEGYTASIQKLITNALPVITQNLHDPKAIANSINKILDGHRIQFYNSYKNNFIKGEMTNLISSLSGLSHLLLHPSITSQVENNSELKNLFDSLKGGITHQVVLGEKIDTYGKGFSPFFISISLWAGALSGTFIIKNQRTNRKTGTFKTYFGKTLVWQLTSFIQSIFLAFAISLLGTRVDTGWKDQWQLIVFIIAVSSLFSLIVQGIGSMFRYADVGKFIVVILLILNLVASSGSFPSFMQPKFFEVITPYLPFHYSIEGMRHILWKPSAGVIIKNLALLMIFPLVTMSSALLHNFIFDKLTHKKFGHHLEYEIETGDR